jgi:hypothetical protein
MERVDVKTLGPVLIAAAMLVYAGLALHTRRPVTSSLSMSSLAVVFRDAAPDLDLDAHGNLDVHGNEVTHAVAEYSLDVDGSLYELHAPQVELPHLGSPKS